VGSQSHYLTNLVQIPSLLNEFGLEFTVFFASTGSPIAKKIRKMGKLGHMAKI